MHWQADIKLAAMPHFSPSLAAISLLLPLGFTSVWAAHPLQQWTGKYVGSCTTLARRYADNKCFDSSTVDSYVAFPMIVAITQSGSSYSWSYSTAPVSGPGWTASREEELLLPIKSVKRVGSRGSTYCMSVDYPNDDRKYSYTVTLRKQGSTQVIDLQYSQDWRTTSRVRHACLTSSPKVTCSERLHVQLKLCTLYKY